jgi:hypothetical protein
MFPSPILVFLAYLCVYWRGYGPVFISSTDDKETKFPFTVYAHINSFQFAEITNLDFDDAYEEYVNLSDDNPYKYLAINSVAINAVNSYDNGGINANNVLTLAKRLLEYLYKNNPSDNWSYINLLQVYRRERELSKSERTRLLEIANEANVMLQSACYLLLDNQEQSDFCFNKLDTEEREKFARMPICHFRASGRQKGSDGEKMQIQEIPNTILWLLNG